jgi:hypothetical protein
VRLLALGVSAQVAKLELLLEHPAQASLPEPMTDEAGGGRHADAEHQIRAVRHDQHGTERADDEEGRKHHGGRQR